MTKENFIIKSNIFMAADTYIMSLAGNTKALSRPGQFVNISVDGFYLRRPFCVSDWDDTGMTLIYTVVGSGTEIMSRLKENDTLDILVGLGNGYDLEAAKGKKIALVAGGAGIAPFIGIARRLSEQEESFTAVLGFNDKDSVLGLRELKPYCADIRISTVDGSGGIKGNVTDILKDTDYDYFFACGPEAMLAALHKLNKEGQISLDARMGCGFGVCMGCSRKMKTGIKRICVDGPVFLNSEVTFDE